MATAATRRSSQREVPPEEPLRHALSLLLDDFIETQLEDDIVGDPWMFWHPVEPRLFLVCALAAEGCVLCELDATAQCRRASAKSRLSPAAAALSPDGSRLVIFGRGAAVAVYLTDSLRCESSFDVRSRKSDWRGALLAPAPGRRPPVYFAFPGAISVRLLSAGATLAPGAPAPPAGASSPLLKLKSDNRRSLSALAAHPHDPDEVLALFEDGAFCVGAVSRAEGSVSFGVPLQTGVQGPGAQLIALAHPSLPGAALVAAVPGGDASVPAAVLEIGPSREVRAVARAALPAGSRALGAGFQARGERLLLAGLLPSGDVSLRALSLVPGARGEVSALPCAVAPAALREVLGAQRAEWASAGAAAFHPASGAAAFAPPGERIYRRRPPPGERERGAQAARPPPALALVHLLSAWDPAQGLGAPRALGSGAPERSDSLLGRASGVGPEPRACVRVPRALQVLSRGRASAYDLALELVSQSLGPFSEGGVRLVGASLSTRRGLWIGLERRVDGGAQARLSRQGDAALGALSEGGGAEGAPRGFGGWVLQARDAVFAGQDDRLVVALSPGGGRLETYDCGALDEKRAAPAPGAVAALGLQGGWRLLPGPPAHVPAAPRPRPESPRAVLEEEGRGEGEEDRSASDASSDASDASSQGEDPALADWEASEARRKALPARVLLLTREGQLRLLEAPLPASLPGAARASGVPAAKPAPSGPSVGTLLAPVIAAPPPAAAGGGAAAPAQGAARCLGALALASDEALVGVRWQIFADDRPGVPELHAGVDPEGACAAALGLVLTTARALLVDQSLRVLAAAAAPRGGGPWASACWAGPSALLASVQGQVFQLLLDGQLLHAASLPALPAPAALLAALPDRLVLAREGPGAPDVGARAFDLGPALARAWAAAGRRAAAVPGGRARAGAALRLVAERYCLRALSARDLLSMARGGGAAAVEDLARGWAREAERPDAEACAWAAAAARALTGGDWEELLDRVEDECRAAEEAAEGADAEDADDGAFRPLSALARSARLRERVLRARARALAAARAAAARGRWAAARRASQAGRAWGEVLALAAAGGDWGALAQEARSGGDAALAVAHQVLAVNEKAFSGQGRGSDRDWAVAAGWGEGGGGAAGGVPGSPAAMAGSLTAQALASLSLEVGEEGEEGRARGLPPRGQAPLIEAALEGEAQGRGQLLRALAAGELGAWGGAGMSQARGQTGLVPGSSSPQGSTPSLQRGSGSGAAGGPVSPEGAASWDLESEHSGLAVAAPVPSFSVARGPPTAGSVSKAPTLGRIEDEEEEDDFFSSDEEDFAASWQRQGAGGLGGSGNMGSEEPEPRTIPSAASTPRSRGLSRQGTGLDGEAAGAPLGSGRRFNVTIRQLQAGEAAPEKPAAPSSGPPDLRSAMQNIRLAPPPAAARPPLAPLVLDLGEPGSSRGGASGGAAPDPFDFFGTPAPAPSPAPAPPAPARAPAAPAPGGGAPMRAPAPPPPPASDLLQGWDDFEAQFGGPAAPGPPPGRASTPPAASGAASLAQAPPPALAAYEEGSRALLAGAWAEAAARLRAALAAAGGARGAELARRGVQHYAAARLLAAGEGGADARARAQAARHAAAAELDDEVGPRVWLLAVELNMAVGNYAYASEMLTRCVAACTEGRGRGVLVPARLQSLLNRCDQAGYKNAEIPRDEDVETFCSLLGSSASAADVDDLVSALAAAWKGKGRRA